MPQRPTAQRLRELENRKNVEMAKQTCFQRREVLAVTLKTRFRKFTAILILGSDYGELISTGRLLLEIFAPETSAEYQEMAKNCIIFY